MECQEKTLSYSTYEISFIQDPKYSHHLLTSLEWSLVKSRITNKKIMDQSINEILLKQKIKKGKKLKDHKFDILLIAKDLQ